MHIRHDIRAFRLPLAAAGLAGALGLAGLHAASITWTGTGSGSFTATENWSSGTVPGLVSDTASTDAVVISAASPASFTVTVDDNRNIMSVTTVASGRNVTFAGGSFILSPGATVMVGNTYTSTQTYNLPLYLAGNATFGNVNASAVGQMIIVNGTVSAYNNGVAGTRTLTLTGKATASNVIAGVIADGGGNAVAVSKGDSGLWVLGNANTFSGGVTFVKGTLALGTDAALGTGTLTFNGTTGGTLRSADAAARTLANPVAFSAQSNSFSLGSATTGNLLFTYTSALVSLQATNRTQSLAINNTVQFMGGFTNGNLALSGTGTLILSGSSNYRNTTLANGTLKVDNPYALGTGTVTLSGGVLDLTSYNVGNVINITSATAAVRLQTSTASLTTTFAAGSQYAGWQRSDGATTACLLSGTASALQTVTSSWSTDHHGNPNVVSGVLDIKGTGSDVYVLQLTYAESADNDANAALGYWNGSGWVNAGGGTFVNGAYDGSLTAGTWGRDAGSDTVWAVLDHNSEYAVVVPEPAGVALLGLGCLTIVLRKKRN